MSTAACLPIAADRAGPCVRTIFVVGLDLTGVVLAMEMRLNPETPGAAAVALGMGATANAEGLRLIGVTVTNGVPTSQVVMRVNEATMKDPSKVPYAGELGSSYSLFYDLIGMFGQDKRRLCYGTFTALPTVYGMEGAPSQRAQSYGAPDSGAPTWSSATLTFANDTVTITIDGADLVGLEVGKAQTASAAAIAARDGILNDAGFQLVAADLGTGDQSKIGTVAASAANVAAVAADLALGADSYIRRSPAAALKAYDWAEGAGEPGGAGTKSAKGWAEDAKAASISANAAAGAGAAAAVDIIAADFGILQLCDPTKVAPGYQSNGDSSGAFNGDGSWFHTGLMRCKPGGQAIVGVDKGDGNGTVGFQVGQGGYGIILYDATGTKVGAIDGPIPAGQPITFPAGAGVQFAVQGPTSYNQFANNGWRLTVVTGAVLPSTYLEYGLLTRAKVLASVRSSMIPLYVNRTQNLVQPQNITQNVYIPAGAITFQGNGDWVAVRAPVTPGGTVTLSYKTYQGYWWEDELGARMPMVTALPAPTNVHIAAGYQLAVPATAVAIVYSLEKSAFARNFQMRDGAVTLGSANAATPATLADKHVWSDRTICFKGDSRWQGKGWIPNLCKALGATPLDWSRGGQAMSHALTRYHGAYTDAAGNVVAAADRPMVQADLANVHAVLLSLTYNSAYQSQPIGTFDDVVPEAGSGAAMPANFIPAMRYALRTYRAWTPSIWVGVVGTQHRYEDGGAAGDAADARERQYRLIEQQVCLEESVPYLDFMTESGFCKGNIAADWPDAVHPTDQAHERRTRRVIQGWLETKLPLA